MKNFFKKLFSSRKDSSEEVDLFNEQEEDVDWFNEPEINTLNFLNTSYIITDKWIEIFTHFILLDQYNKMPDKGWYQDLKLLIGSLGEDEFVSIGAKWVADCIEKSKENNYRYKKLGVISGGEVIQSDVGFGRGVPEWVEKVYGNRVSDSGFVRMNNHAWLNDFQNYFYQSIGGRILRGFIHSIVVLTNKGFINLVDLVALTNPNNSQDAIHVYSQLPRDVGVPKLLLLKSKATNKNILARINKSIAEVGKKYGMSKAQIEESIVPDFGLNLKGEYVFTIENVDCVFEFKNIRSSRFYYKTDNGKEQKSIPVSIESNCPEKVKDFKKGVKDIKSAIGAHRNRIEEFYLNNWQTTFANFSENYFDNGLVRLISKDLIWNFKDKDFSINLICKGNDLVDSKGRKNEYDLSNCVVSLWHPIESDSTYVIDWRNFLIDNEILQPFKQAFREVYLVTDAEIATESYSNRFASHILNKDHVSALSKERGWSPAGIINYGRISYRIPDSDFKAEYWVGDVYLGEHSKTYGSAHVSTDQVRFYKKKDLVNLIDLPAVIFSEVMRDVDLFVGVTSIGNDPNWHDRGEEGTSDYWSTYGNDELTERSKVRKDILKNIIPKLKISKFCKFDGRYLRVEGKIRNYKIHIGSGNILMEPNDHYLCIVADRSSSSVNKLFIPFEGDNLLSIIISKAILLADDDKITDQTIVRQIQGK